MLPLGVYAEFHTAMALELTPVAPKQTADRDVAINLQTGWIATAFRKIQVDQIVHLLPVVHGVNGKHGNIQMGVLHSGIFPVDKLDFFFAALTGHKHEVIWDGINVAENTLFWLCVDIVLQ